MEIKTASQKDLESIVPLFDAYRIFYGQPSDLEAARTFLNERFGRNENKLFLAQSKGEPLGFTQLYKTFSSVSLMPFYILNDLYVASNHRNKGVGKALLEHAQLFCKKEGFKGLALETALDNPAQKLYETLEWELDKSYLHYFWTNPNPSGV
ncbi:GNAT family N-acetyltransferase [Flagellimonas meridianipacifica]|uniref:Ribosomal protein S18 acetylase RimI-like enzyme n=1 Tax=Flagellimonas meridianipacifica TaxID=1080225 RepID=A0A2T0MAH9_9FLAO|nr:GNAT family N-acetyltransferase [Allomuricauda pacifica]PRX54479.1 ribosomal protein S18 acetylase RimI-like enzyme [Allomuricauda pacifica]